MADTTRRAGMPVPRGASAAAAEHCVFSRPRCLADTPFTYCPGCGHGTIVRIVAEVIDELEIADRAIVVGSVGCAVWVYDFFDLDGIGAPHGRAPALATGIKRARPENIIFTIQGDGDLAAIGTAEVIHAATRGEKVTCIFVNNAVFGMTQGQMAPTTLLGQKTTTSPRGRSAEREGYPIRITEMVAQCEGTAYAARVTVADPRAVRHAKRAVRKAFQAQIEGRGFSLVEILSICPTWWGKPPQEAAQWVKDVVSKHFVPGELKTFEADEAAAPPTDH